MKKTIILIAAFLQCGIFYSKAQITPTKLLGKVIGTTDCFDYGNNLCSAVVNTPANAFDNDFTTIFASCARSGGWVGLDLGEPYVITSVAYCPRLGNGTRMVLGVFEGANHADFGDAVPIFMITAEPSQNVLTQQDINCSRGFRYVRYVGPNDAKSNVADLVFYGYKGIGDNSLLPTPSNLPAVIIHTTNAQDIVSKDVYLKGIVSVISNNGKTLFTDSLEIKGRGNASWDFPKKPYRMKLYNKASLLELPATAKSWTLINNYGDKTLMRNLIAFDLSQRLDMPYTPAGKPVDVFLNGEYKGTYQLCDQIEVGSNRVEVDKLKPADIALPNLSGGYFVEMDAYAYTEALWFSSTRGHIPVTIKSPDEDAIVPQQKTYISTHFNAMESAVYASNYKDVTSGYRKYIDVETMIRHFLVGEISGNTDTYWSTYLYKKRNDDHFYFGPVWDFDIAFENDYRTYPINNLTNWVFATNGSAATGVRELVNRIFTDASFVTRLKEVYAQYRNSGALSPTAIMQMIDDYAIEIDASQTLNYKRWNILNQQVHMNPTVYGSYQGEVSNVKNYLTRRISWMDQKLAYVPTVILDAAIETIRIWSDDQVLRIAGLNSDTDVTIYNLSGLMVSFQHVDAEFSLSLKSGVYIIRITDASGMRAFKCLVK